MNFLPQRAAARWPVTLIRAVDPNLWLILALSTFAWAPLLTPAYFFNAHDARHSVFFLVEFDQTFRDGYLWPRWSPDFSFGYGYPLFNLYAPLAFYAAQIIHLLGVGFTAAIKTMYIVATIGAGWSMYGFTRRLFGPRSALLAAIVYVYVPFHLVEIFVRSAYAEFVALALIPLVFWAFTELIAAPTGRRLALAGLVYGLLALTHHTSFFTFTPLLAIYVLYLIAAQSTLRLARLTPLSDHPPSQPSPRRGRSQISPRIGGSKGGLHQSWPTFLISRSLYAIGAGLLGLALAAIYLIPLISEMRFVKVEQWTSGSYNYLDHFVYFSQFLDPAWGYGYAGVGLQDDVSFQVGIVIIVLLCFATVTIIRHAFIHRGTALFFLIATLVVTLLMSPLARPVWQILPIAALVQFPWRLLGVTAFTMSIVAGSLLAVPKIGKPQRGEASLNAERSHLRMRPPQSPAPLYVLLLVVILASFSYTQPQYTPVPDWTETPLAVINWDRASIVDRVGMVSVADEQPQSSPMEAEYLADGYPTTVAGIIAGRGTVETLHHGGASDKVRVVAAEPVTVQFYTYDYPGWQVTLDGQPLDHRPEPPFGLITVDVPPGDHTLHLRMGSTLPRLVGTITSLAAVGLIAALLIFARSSRPSPTFDN